MFLKVLAYSPTELFNQGDGKLDTLAELFHLVNREVNHEVNLDYLCQLLEENGKYVPAIWILKMVMRKYRSALDDFDIKSLAFVVNSCNSEALYCCINQWLEPYFVQESSPQEGLSKWHVLLFILYAIRTHLTRDNKQDEFEGALTQLEQATNVSDPDYTLPLAFFFKGFLPPELRALNSFSELLLAMQPEWQMLMRPCNILAPGDFFSCGSDDESGSDDEKGSFVIYDDRYGKELAFFKVNLGLLEQTQYHPFKTILGYVLLLLQRESGFGPGFKENNTVLENYFLPPEDDQHKDLLVCVSRKDNIQMIEAFCCGTSSQDTQTGPIFDAQGVYSILEGQSIGTLLSFRVLQNGLKFLQGQKPEVHVRSVNAKVLTEAVSMMAVAQTDDSSSLVNTFDCMLRISAQLKALFLSNNFDDTVLFEWGLLQLRSKDMIDLYTTYLKNDPELSDGDNQRAQRCFIAVIDLAGFVFDRIKNGRIDVEKIKQTMFGKANQAFKLHPKFQHILERLVSDIVEICHSAQSLRWDMRFDVSHARVLLLIRAIDSVRQCKNGLINDEEASQILIKYQMLNNPNGLMVSSESFKDPDTLKVLNCVSRVARAVLGHDANCSGIFTKKDFMALNLDDTETILDRLIANGVIKELGVLDPHSFVNGLDISEQESTGFFNQLEANNIINDSGYFLINPDLNPSELGNYPEYVVAVLREAFKNYRTEKFMITGDKSKVLSAIGVTVYFNRYRNFLNTFWPLLHDIRGPYGGRYIIDTNFVNGLCRIERLSRFIAFITYRQKGYSEILSVLLSLRTANNIGIEQMLLSLIATGTFVSTTYTVDRKK